MTKKPKLPKMEPGGKLAQFTASKTSTEPDVDTTGAAAAAPKLGTKKLTLSLNDAAWMQFRMLALEQRTSGQKLLIQAVNLLFEHHGRKPVA